MVGLLINMLVAGRFFLIITPLLAQTQDKSPSTQPTAQITFENKIQLINESGRL